jgi:hypothetical protein
MPFPVFNILKKGGAPPIPVPDKTNWYDFNGVNTAHNQDIASLNLFDWRIDVEVRRTSNSPSRQQIFTLGDISLGNLFMFQDSTRAVYGVQDVPITNQFVDNHTVLNTDVKYSVTYEYSTQITRFYRNDVLKYTQSSLPVNLRTSNSLLYYLGRRGADRPYNGRMYYFQILATDGIGKNNLLNMDQKTGSSVLDSYGNLNWTALNHNDAYWQP